jgi:hypothetical protein
MSPEDMKAGVIACLHAGPTRWTAIAGEFSASLEWLCRAVEDDRQSPGKAIADYRGLFAESMPFADWRSLAKIVEEGFSVLRTQRWAHQRWIAHSDVDVMDAFPAYRLIAAYGEIGPEWHRRWRAAGGALRNGEMIALKFDAVWSRINEYGQPFPPFEWEGRLDLEDVDRETAERLRLIASKPPPKAKSRRRSRRPPPSTGCLAVVAVLFLAASLAVAITQLPRK